MKILIRPKMNFSGLSCPLLAILLMILPGMQGKGLSQSPWTMMESVYQAGNEPGTCILDGKIYIMGGADFTIPQASMAVYDPINDSFTPLKDLPSPRQGLSANSVGGKIYAMGGADLTDMNNPIVYADVFEYDPATDTWTSKTPLPDTRAFHTAEVIDGKIHVIGGSSSRPYMGLARLSLDVYDPQTDTWSKKADIPRRIGAGSSCVADGKIYAFSGYGGLLRVHEYDPESDTWTDKSNAPRVLISPACIAYNGKIYLMGGHINANNYSATSTVDVYDPIQDVWTSAADMQKSRCGNRGELIDGKFYVFGGFTGSWLSAMSDIGEIYNPAQDLLPWSTVIIPDTVFLHALIDEGVDTNRDSLISYAEAVARDTLDIDIGKKGWAEGKEFESLSGIEAFKNLVYLNISGRGLSHIDITRNTALQGLQCIGNNLTSLDVSQNIALTYLNVGCFHHGCYYSNQLTSLDVSQNRMLEWLSCTHNQLSTLDVSNNTSLLGLYCDGNQLSFLDVSQNTSLTNLMCSYNHLGALDVSKCTSLEYLVCSQNDLTSLDVSKHPSLKLLYCEENQLSMLDVSVNTLLTNLDCGGNQLHSLDITHNTSLEFLALTNMPTLHEVCVWDLPFPYANITLWDKDSPNIEFASTCTAGNMESIPGSVSIHPNPSSGLLHIETVHTGHSTFKITSLNGQRVLSGTMNGSIHQLDLSTFQEGVYFLTIKSKDYVCTRKIVKL